MQPMFCDNLLKLSPAEAELELCPRGPSCCTAATEARLADWSEEQFRQQLANRTAALATELQHKATQVDGELRHNNSFFTHLEECSIFDCVLNPS